MAAATTTETWDALWTLSRRAKRKRLTDNISDEYPTLDRFKRGGVMESETGGKQIQEDLMYALQTAEWFDDYDVLSTTRMDGITAALFDWAYLACPIVISLTEEMESRASDKALRLIDAKDRQASQGAMDQMNASLLSAQAGKSILGLQDMVPESANTYGGINAATETWWDNQRLDFNATYTSFLTKPADQYQGVLAMSSMYNSCAEGNDQPNLIISPYSVYGSYENLFEGTGHLRTSAKGPNVLDGREPAFRAAPFVPDRDCGSDQVFMLNTKYIHYKIQSGMNFAKTPFRNPPNQLAKVAFVIVGSQLTCNHRQRQGIIYDMVA